MSKYPDHACTCSHTCPCRKQSCSAHIAASGRNEHLAKRSLIAARITHRKEVCRFSVHQSKHRGHFFKSTPCDPDLGQMADACINSTGMEEMSALIKGKSRSLIASDRASHHAPVVRRDAGRDIHGNDIASKTIPAEVDGLHTFGSLARQIPRETCSEKSVDDQIGYRRGRLSHRKRCIR